MLFKNPSILYFLFLLIIPILVHLFQFRRFKNEYFTNVAFLKNLQIQTRKSATIKKWLLLLTRLLIFTALILAFAMPYFPVKENAMKEQELVVVVDNSFSMEAKGKNGELLKKSLVDLIKNIPEEQAFTLLTNDNIYKEITIKGFRNELQNIGYSAVGWNLENVTNRLKNLQKGNVDLLLITDGIDWDSFEKIQDLNPVWHIPSREISHNIAVDSVYIQSTTDLFYNLGVVLKKYGETTNPVTVSVMSNQKAIANQSFTATKNEETLTFTIPKNTEQAQVVLEDASIPYDNKWFFSIPTPKKQAVMSIGAVEKSGFLAKIFTADEFNYQAFTTKNIEYNVIEKQDAVVLNEVAEISVALQNTLKTFVEKGGQLIIIPNEKQDITQLNQWLVGMNVPQLEPDLSADKKITTINFNHPVFKGVFEKKITNFQYPKSKAFFKIKKQGVAVLGYEDQSPFLTATNYQNGLVYLFTNPLEKQVSNFQNSPLIVPTFYNMGQRLQKKIPLSFTVGKNETLVLDLALPNESIMTVANAQSSFIPLQQSLGTQTKVSFFENPTIAGNYDLIFNENVVKRLSFNYPRNESNILSQKDNFPKDLKLTESIPDYFNTLQANRNPNYLWKWLVLIGILFLLLELLIQKFVR
uniref:BatA domain-containing protein n=1 Tax=Flavobacterium sp. TaxID=239 RepID=UPI00404B13B3